MNGGFLPFLKIVIFSSCLLWLVWYNFFMNKAQMIEFADRRLDSYIRKVFGQNIHVLPEVYTALHDYMKSGKSFERQLVNFLNVCDQHEEELLKPKADTSLEWEDEHAIKLIDFARKTSF